MQADNGDLLQRRLRDREKWQGEEEKGEEEKEKFFLCG